MKELNDRLLEVLNLIEESEEKLLSWGITAIGLRHIEITGIISQITGNPSNTDQVIQILKRKGWIREIKFNGVTSYRSRMAETVFLLSKLRQWWHDEQPWQKESHHIF